MTCQYAVFSAGIDIVEIKRIKGLLKKSSGVLEKLFTIRELSLLNNKTSVSVLYTEVGRLFAIKEAVLKACNIGWQEGVSWHDIEILDCYQCCTIKLKGKLNSIARKYHINRVIAAASAEKAVVIAQALALKKHNFSKN